MHIERMIDANLNRVSEGLRVIEDSFRFVYEEETLQGQIRILKHKVRKTINADHFINFRNPTEDIGLTTSQESVIDNKSNVRELVTANFKRVQEGLRTIEECLKLLGQTTESKEYEKMRFESYEIEKQCMGIFMFPKTDLYGILCEKLSMGKTNFDVAKELIKAGVKIIQYREKEKSKIDKLKECISLLELTKAAGCLLIVNDDLDIALAIGADGVHLGQHDLPVEVARKIAPHLILGVSTHRESQALRAVEMGADYIGVGPVFETQTKLNVEGSDGLKYVKWVSENIRIPFVTIGGIGLENINVVKDHGGSCFAMISELVSAEKIRERVSVIRKELMQ